MKVLILGVVLVCSSAYAADREDKIKTLMEAQGLLITIEQQLDLARVQNKEQAERFMDQVMSQLDPSPEFQSRFEDAFNKFIKAVEMPWGTDEIVEVWAKYYGEKFTDEELDQLIEFYSSKLGQKDAVASREALVQFNNHFVEVGKPIADKAAQEYIKDLQTIAKECKCKRSRQSAKPTQ